MAEGNEVVLQYMEDITRKAKAVQENILAEIVSKNASTEYLSSFHLDEAADRLEAFKSKVPVANYADLQPFIGRIADGDSSPILCAQPVSQFFLSSGTSGGDRKLVPSTKQSRDQTSSFYNIATAVLNQRVKGAREGKGLMFLYTRKEIATKGGIPAAPATTTLFKSDFFNNIVSKAFTSPTEAIYCVDVYQSTYAQMLCGLYERDRVHRVGASFASGLLRAINFLQLNWQLLIHDIRTGTLNPKITDPAIRERMGGLMRPDPALAELIAHECASDTWEGIIPRIWPNTKFLRTIITGSMSQYIQSLDYYSRGLPIVSMIYVSSECYFGINLNPMSNPYQVSYTIMPNMAYFEFLPYDPNSIELNTHQQLVDLANVEIDKEYELVVTTYAGLYRYRVGDILRVTGFYNSTPQFQFVCRKNALLSVDVEKTDEEELQGAVDKAALLLGEFNMSLVDYTSYPDSSAIPGHYVIYCELLVNESNESPSDEVLRRCCLEMEESLNFMYRRLRNYEVIGALEIRVLKNGTFEKMAEFALSQGACVSQYKVPRCIRDQRIISFLNSRLVSTHFSLSLPRLSQV